MAQLSTPANGTPAGVGGGAGPAEVLADRHRRVVRRQHEPDDPLDAGGDERGDAGLDLRGRRA